MISLNARPNPFPTFVGTGLTEDPPTHHNAAQTDRASPSL